MRRILVFAVVLVASGVSAQSIEDHCKKDCSHYSGPEVCASDHKTYANMCEFSVAACIAHELHLRTLHVEGRGKCPNYYTLAPPVNHCNDVCDEDVSPLCASDGKIYDNKCRFLRARCEAARMNVTLFFVVQGSTCPPHKQPACEKYHIDTSDLAFEDGAVFTPKCPTRQEYLCASNGKTYANECQLCGYLDASKENLVIVASDICPH